MNRLMAVRRWTSPSGSSPLLGGYHPRDHVERPCPVDVARLGVNGESDAHRPDSQLGRRLPPRELIAE